MTNYSLKSCENLIEKYVSQLGGQCLVIEEGVLGLGTVLLYGLNGYVNILIKEFFINEWTSGHKVVKYNKLPKKYIQLIETMC